MFGKYQFAIGFRHPTDTLSDYRRRARVKVDPLLFTYFTRGMTSKIIITLRKNGNWKIYFHIIWHAQYNAKCKYLFNGAPIAYLM